MISKIKTLQDIAFESKINDISEFIQVKIPIDYNRLNCFAALYDAIRNIQTIDFKHNIFNSWKPHTVEPYLIKEYKNRWYLTGFYRQENRFATFALEGIDDLKNKNIEFKIKTNFSRTYYFKYAFGITVINDFLTEKVILKFSK